MKIPIRKTVLYFVILCTPTVAVVAQTKNESELPVKSYQKLEASYIIGAQVFNDNFVYNPGYAFDFSYGKFLNKSVALGLGSAYRVFENETFVPIYAEILGYKSNKKNTPTIKMQIGYGFAHENSSKSVEDYAFKGGVFIGAGLGRKIKVKNKYSILFNWSYQHQFAKIEYDIFNTTDYREVLNYDMITISIGLIRE